MTQLQRSASQRHVVERLRSLLTDMGTIAAQQFEALGAVTSRILATGRTIEISPDIFQSAQGIERQYALSAQDSVILTSIFSDLTAQPASEPKCFVSSNYKDYGDPDIRRRLRQAGCRYIGSFDAARDYLRAALRGDDLAEPADDH